MKKTIKLLTITSCTLVLSSCAYLKQMNGSNDPSVLYKNYSEAQLFTDAEKNLAKRNWGRAVSMYEGLDSLYPFGAHSQQAQLDSIYAYYGKGDYDSAEAAADRYIHLYPSSENASYAYYMKGLSQLNQSRTFFQRTFPIDMSARDEANLTQAFFTFRDLAQLYPNSYYAPYAKQQLIYIRNLFAKHEMDVANFYFERKAYVAAANRASYIVDHFQGSVYVPNALVILVKSNRALGLDKSANEALQVLQSNFPEVAAKNKL